MASEHAKQQQTGSANNNQSSASSSFVSGNAKYLRYVRSKLSKSGLLGGLASTTTMRRARNMKGEAGPFMNASNPPSSSARGNQLDGQGEEEEEEEEEESEEEQDSMNEEQQEDSEMGENSREMKVKHQQEHEIFSSIQQQQQQATTRGLLKQQQQQQNNNKAKSTTKIESLVRHTSERLHLHGSSSVASHNLHPAPNELERSQSEVRKKKANKVVKVVLRNDSRKKSTSTDSRLAQQADDDSTNASLVNLEWRPTSGEIACTRSASKLQLHSNTICSSSSTTTTTATSTAGSIHIQSQAKKSQSFFQGFRYTLRGRRGSKAPGAKVDPSAQIARSMIMNEVSPSKSAGQLNTNKLHIEIGARESTSAQRSPLLALDSTPSPVPSTASTGQYEFASEAGFSFHQETKKHETRHFNSMASASSSSWRDHKQETG